LWRWPAPLAKFSRMDSTVLPERLQFETSLIGWNKKPYEPAAVLRQTKAMTTPLG
jgi:hypothetical protein